MSLITESQTQTHTHADPGAPWESVFMFTRYRANWIYIVLPWNNTKTFNQLKLGTTILHKVTAGANYTEREQCRDGIRHSDASLKELSYSRLGRKLITVDQLISVQLSVGLMAQVPLLTDMLKKCVLRATKLTKLNFEVARLQCRRCHLWYELLSFGGIICLLSRKLSSGAQSKNKKKELQLS